MRARWLRFSAMGPVVTGFLACRSEGPHDRDLGLDSFEGDIVRFRFRVSWPDVSGVRKRALRQLTIGGAP